MRLAGRIQSVAELVMTYIDAAFRQECDSSLRVSRLVLGQELELVVLVLKVSDVAISARQISILFPDAKLFDVDLPLAREVQAVGTIVPERHAHSRDRV